MHLRTTGDERWNAFLEIVRVAQAEGAELLVISGDMFDKKINAERLRVALRESFESLAAHVLILPGNHDQGALASGQYFGDRVTVMSEAGALFENGSVRVIALPFERLDGAAVMERLLALRAATVPGATNILLFHGELLDIFYDRERYGDEEDSGYMPVRLSHLRGLGFDYVLAGHFHSQFEIQSYGDGYFVYPGSPVSVTRKEQGRRKCNLFETGGAPREREIDTFHYVTLEHTLDPFDPGTPLDSIRRDLEACHAGASIDLVIDGFIDLDKMQLTEEEFKQRLDSLKSDRVERMTHAWSDIGTVLQHELYKRFERRLQTGGHDPARAQKMRRMAIEAIMEVLGAD